jgi:hypothetical protein
MMVRGFWCHLRSGLIVNVPASLLVLHIFLSFLGIVFTIVVHTVQYMYAQMMIYYSVPSMARVSSVCTYFDIPAAQGQCCRAAPSYDLQGLRSLFTQAEEGLHGKLSFVKTNAEPTVCSLSCPYDAAP